MLTLTATEASGTTYIETGDRGTQGPQAWNRFEIDGGPALVVIGDKIYRPTVADVYSDGDVWIFFTRVTRRGTLYKSGEGIWETLRGLERTGRLAEVTAPLREALADKKEREAAERRAQATPAEKPAPSFKISDYVQAYTDELRTGASPAVAEQRVDNALAEVRANLHKIAVEEADQDDSCPLPGGICDPDVDHDHDPLSPELAAMLGEPTFETELPKRTVENWYALPGDPAVWGPKYHQGLKSYGDNGTNCVLCGKRTGGKKNTSYVLVSHQSTALPVAELPEGWDFMDTMGEFPIGSECAKELPAKFLISPQG